MAGNRHIPKLEDQAYAAWLKNRFFQVELPADTSIERQHAAISLVEMKTIKLVMPSFLLAVIDNDREQVKALLEDCPQLLLVKPDKNLVIESKRTWEKLYAEEALKMAAKRKQIKMVELMLPYYDKLPQTEEVIKAKTEALLTWKPYEIQKNEETGEDEIVIPQEYAILAQSLIDVFQDETFPNGVPGINNIPLNIALSEKTELALSSLLNILVPKTAVRLDEHIDAELLLLAIYKAYVKNFPSFNYNWDKLDMICIRAMGLTQSALIPETGEIYCESLDDVVAAIENGKEKEISDRAAAYKLKGGEDFYRASRASRFGSGFEFLCGILGGVARDGGRDGAGGGGLEKLCQTKTTNFWKCYAAIAAPVRPSPNR